MVNFTLKRSASGTNIPPEVGWDLPLFASKHGKEGEPGGENHRPVLQGSDGARVASQRCPILCQTRIV
jgi:hypothetical protein